MLSTKAKGEAHMPPLLLEAQIFLDNKNCLCQSDKSKRMEDVPL